MPRTSQPSAATISRNPGLVPTMLHHAAWVTHDAGATCDFYTKIMGMELVSSVICGGVESTGDDFPFLHIFFKLKDGSTFAFFESPGLPPAAKPSHPAYDVFNHVALEVSSPQEVQKWHEWLQHNGVGVVGPTHHEEVISVYFHDPNGLRLEIAASLTEDWNNQPARAKRDVARWLEAKEKAKLEGRDVVEAMKEFARRSAAH